MLTNDALDNAKTPELKAVAVAPAAHEGCERNSVTLASALNAYASPVPALPAPLVGGPGAIASPADVASEADEYDESDADIEAEMEFWAARQHDREIDQNTIGCCANLLCSFILPDEDEEGDISWKMTNLDGPLRNELVIMLRQAARTATAALKREQSPP